jgi:hypothetical protein
VRRWHLAVCLSLVVPLLHASLAVACINDSETVRTETEFKKHYEFKSGYQEKSPSTESPTTINQWMPITAAWSGAALLVGTLALITFNVRKVGRT